MLATTGPLAPGARPGWSPRSPTSIAGAHDAGVAHGRLVPENVLVDRNGAVRVIGFAVDAAPARAAHGPGRATDVVDLGGLLYAALTGRWPGVSLDVLPAPHEHGQLLRPRQVRAGIPRPSTRCATRCSTRRHAGAHAREAYDLTTRRAGSATTLREFVGDPPAWPRPRPSAGSASRRPAPAVLPPLPHPTVPTRDARRSRSSRRTPAGRARGDPGDQPSRSRLGPSESGDPTRGAARDPHDASPSRSARGAPAHPPHAGRRGRSSCRPRPACRSSTTRPTTSSWLPPAPSRRRRRRPSRSRRSARCSRPTPTDGSRPARPRPARPRRRAPATTGPGTAHGTGTGCSPAPARASSPATDGRRRRRCPGAAGCGSRRGRCRRCCCSSLVVGLNLGRGRTPLGAEPTDPRRRSASPVGRHRGPRHHRADRPPTSTRRATRRRRTPSWPRWPSTATRRTAWRTVTYSQNFGPGGLKTGVGLVLDLGEPHRRRRGRPHLVGEPDRASRSTSPTSAPPASTA